MFNTLCCFCSDQALVSFGALGGTAMILLYWVFTLLRLIFETVLHEHRQGGWQTAALEKNRQEE